MPGPVLAMHMSNELLSPSVAIATCVLAGAAVLVALRAGRNMQAAALPLMGVLGAFVFAAQMINFPVPFLPVSGHLIGTALLALLLGPWAAIITITAILIVQCMLFGDGGVLALGCNILNMAVVPSLLSEGVYRALGLRARVTHRHTDNPTEAAHEHVAMPSPARLYAAVYLAAMAGVLAAAVLVPLEVALSGVLRVKPTAFLGVMLAVHVPIAFMEGLITFAIVTFLRRVRPQVLGLPVAGGVSSRRARTAVLAGSILLTALLLGGVVSNFASSLRDGMEYSVEQHGYGQTVGAVENPSPAVAAAEHAQAQLVPLADSESAGGWLSLAGLAGTLVALGVIYFLSRLLRRRGPAHSH